MQPVIYDCLSCHTQVTGSAPAPTQWQWNQRQVPRLLCPQCGCACAPQAWRLAAFEVCVQHQSQGMNIDALAHALWSNCPNSLTCQSVQAYAGNCEQAQVLMPKCLAAVHARLERAERRTTLQR